MLTAPGLSRIHQISIRARGGVRLLVAPAEPEFDHQGSIIYFGVEDITTTHAALRASGVTFRTEPHMVAKLPDREVWLADFEDSEGNVLALMSEPKV